MAAVHEIQSFIQKFQHLCNNGVQANLNFSNYHGSIVVNFNANLGIIALPFQSYDTRPEPHVKPTQLRRRKRRQNVRANLSKTDHDEKSIVVDVANESENNDDGAVTEEVEARYVTSEVVDHPSHSNQFAPMHLSDSDINDAPPDQPVTSEETRDVLTVEDFKKLFMEELKTSAIQGIQDGIRSAFQL